MVLVQQILSGKTNKKAKLLGRVMRNKYVTLCAVGALRFYLLYRFHTTNEWDPVPNFSDNQSWYKVKLLLVHPYSDDYTQCISDRTYMTAIKDVCLKLKIASNHYLHIGGVLGALELEGHEDLAAEIRQLGNWDPSTVG
jgi:Centromere DNA-binding protein complex CBF3 subunit, domain 2